MELTKLKISQITQLISSQKVTEEEVYSQFLDRIEKYDTKINAFVEVQTKAHNISPKISKNTFGKLQGIPFSTKDIYLAENVTTTASSKVLENFCSPYSATVYQRLVNEGAKLIGKTNNDAWGFGGSTENSDFKVTTNPWNNDYVPGGSSGGSGAAVASRMSEFCLGGDTGGSIRMPSCYCGVVGLKPTYGLVPRYGVIEFASSLDVVGPLAKSVEDIALILEVIAGKDPKDATSLDVEKIKYSQVMNKQPEDIVIGIPEEYFDKNTIDASVNEKIEEAINIMKQNGIKFKQVRLPNIEYSIPVYYLIATSEASSNLGRYDGIRYGNDRTHFGSEAKRRIMLGTFSLSSGFIDEYFTKAAKVRRLIQEDFYNAFNEVDMILAPVSPTEPFKIGEKISDPLQMYTADILTVSVNLAGLPSLALPAGLTKKGLPTGFQLIGAGLSEERILQVGNYYENLVGGFATPEL